MSIEGQELVDFADTVKGFLCGIESKVVGLRMLLDKHPEQLSESIARVQELCLCLSEEGIVGATLREEILKPAEAAKVTCDMARQLHFIEDITDALRKIKEESPLQARSIHIKHAIDSLESAAKIYPADAKEYLAKTNQEQP